MASGRKQDSDERLVEAIGRGESVGTKGSGGHSDDHDWKGIRDIVGGYEDAEDSRDRAVIPVDVATQTTDSQSHDVETASLNVRDDKGIADSLGPVKRLLKTRIIRGQSFYWVKWAIAGKASEWIAAKEIPEIMIDNFRKRHTLTGRKRRTNTRWKGLV